MKQKTDKTEGRMDKFTIIFGNLNIPFSVIIRKIQGQSDLNHTIYQLYLIDNSRTHKFRVKKIHIFLKGTLNFHKDRVLFGDTK